MEGTLPYRSRNSASLYARIVRSAIIARSAMKRTQLRKLDQANIRCTTMMVVKNSADCQA